MSSSPRVFLLISIVHERAIDLRYSIQKYELPVPVARGALKADAKDEWRKMFDEIHEKHFGSRAEDQQVGDRQLSIDDQGDGAEAGGSRIGDAG